MAALTTVLVAGATGATGRLLVRELLDRGAHVRAVARNPEKLAAHERLSVIPAAILDLEPAALAQHVQGCDAVASCLGHNLTWSGVFGPPHRLVTDATRRLCEAFRANPRPSRVRFVLMNTTGNRDPDCDPKRSFAETAVVWLLRRLLPPHADNEQAAEYLRTQVGASDAAIEWAAVRPDTLVDAADVTPYDVHPSPIRSAIFDAGRTSRSQVAHFMAELITGDEVWNRWRGQMPVIYSRGAMSENKRVVEKYMDGFRKSDHAQILSCLTDDIEWEMPGAFHHVGKEAFDREIENPAFTGPPVITISRVVEENDVVVAEGEVRAERKDRVIFEAVFCDVFVMSQSRIRKLITYLIPK